jgi:hypothetical protein
MAILVLPDHFGILTGPASIDLRPCYIDGLFASGARFSRIIYLPLKLRYARTPHSNSAPRPTPPHQIPAQRFDRSFVACSWHQVRREFDNIFEVPFSMSNA